MSHVQVKDVSKIFGLKIDGCMQITRALNGVTFDIEQAEIVALAGRSGCGKRTALRLIMGLENPTTGSVLVGNKEIVGCGHDRGMVFQHPELLPWKIVLENVKFALAMKGIPKPEVDAT